MFRTMKLFLFCASVGLIIANCQIALAALDTYELGPFQVSAVGQSAEQAKSNAYGAMYDMLVEIENNLPAGHEFLDVAIEDQGWTSADEYFIDFHVIVWIPNPPGPPAGI